MPTPMAPSKSDDATLRQAEVPPRHRKRWMHRPIHKAPLLWPRSLFPPADMGIGCMAVVTGARMLVLVHRCSVLVALIFTILQYEYKLLIVPLAWNCSSYRYGHIYCTNTIQVQVQYMQDSQKGLSWYTRTIGDSYRKVTITTVYVLILFRYRSKVNLRTYSTYTGIYRVPVVYLYGKTYGTSIYRTGTAFITSILYYGIQWVR